MRYILSRNKVSITGSPNHYEFALRSWLDDNGVRFLAVDQQKRKVFARNKIKTFDMLVYPAVGGGDRGQTLVVEVKGRLFKGAKLNAGASLPNWVTKEDIIGLTRWEQIIGRTEVRQRSNAVFVFSYKFERIDVETDGLETYDFDNNVYCFYAIALDEYRKKMKQRSPKWQTYDLAAADFREAAVPLGKFLRNV